MAFLPSQVAADWPWLAPAIAAVVAASVLVALRRSAALVVLAGALMAVSGFTAARARLLLDVTRGLEGGWPEIDLTTDGIPERLPEYVELRGYFRDAWTLDEYAVAEGGRPDQSKPPVAVLLPFVGTQEDVVVYDGPIVIARVEPGRRATGGIAVIRGKTSTVAPELVASLVQIAGAELEDVDAVLIDTFARPTRREAWTNLAFTFVALAIAGACLWVAAGKTT